jgi:hypothetical protein
MRVLLLHFDHGHGRRCGNDGDNGNYFDHGHSWDELLRRQEGIGTR